MIEWTMSTGFTAWRFYVMAMLAICFVVLARAQYLSRKRMRPEERNLRRAMLLLLIVGFIGVGGRFLLGIGAPEWMSFALIVAGLAGLSVVPLHILYAHTRRDR